MSTNFENNFYFSDNGPENLLPMTEKEVDELALEIDQLIGSEQCYESIEAELQGSFLEFNYKIRSELIYYEDTDIPEKEYTARFSLVTDDLESSPSKPNYDVLHLGYNQRKGFYCEINGERHEDDKTAAELNHYSWFLMRNIILGEDHITIANDPAAMQAAGSGYAIINEILLSGSDPNWQAMHQLTHNEYGGKIIDNEPETIAEDLMECLNQNDGTIVTNSKNISLELDDNSEICFYARTEIKNIESDGSIQTNNLRSIEFKNYIAETKHSQESTQYSKEIELAHTNAQADMLQTVVYEHREETSFFEEQKEYVRLTTNMVGKSDNKTVKSPVIGDFMYFKDKIRQASIALKEQGQ